MAYTLQNDLPSIPLTPEFHAQMSVKRAKLQKELKEVMVRLQDAREMGDLSENGAYKYAKFEIGNIKRELRRLNDLLERGVPTPKKIGSDVVMFASQVTISEEGKKPLSYQLVSAFESDPSQGKLSMESPIGAQLMGKKAGDSIVVQLPSGEKVFRVEAVE